MIIRNKAAIVGAGYFCGLAVAAFASGFAGFEGLFERFEIPPAAWIAAPLAVSAAAVILGVARKSGTAALILLALAAGTVHFGVYNANVLQPVFSQSGETVNLTGTLAEKKELQFNQAAYLVKTRLNGKSARVLLTAEDVHGLNAGDVVSAEVSLAKFRDTGIFPERSYNLSRGVLLKGGADSVELVKNRGFKPPTDYITDYGEYVKSRIAAAFPNDTGGLLRAVFFGDKSGISPELASQIRVAGAAHYTAVSGLHMTMITHMFMLAFALTPYGNNRKVKFAVLLVTVAALAVFFNLTVSVVRAAVMLTVCYGGELFMRKGNTLNSLGFALLLILIFQPYAVFDAGLVMSFSGTFGVGVLAPVFTRNEWFGKLFRNKFRKIAESFTASVCAGLCIIPASALYFGGISVWSPLTSVIVMPFFTVAAGAVMLFAVFAPLAWLGNAFLLAAAVMSKIMTAIIGFFGSVSAAYISLDYWFVPIWTALAITAVAVIGLIYKNNSRAVKAACLTVAVLALMICAYNANAVHSGRTYIRIYSDSSAAWAVAERRGVSAVIVTSDTPKAREQITLRNGGKFTATALLNSVRNNETAFADIPALEYIPPHSENIYDISGQFTLNIRGDEAVLEADGYSVYFTRAANDNAADISANVIVGYNQVRKKRGFAADYIVYASRSVPVEFPNERNAYYEPALFIINNE